MKRFLKSTNSNVLLIQAPITKVRYENSSDNVFFETMMNNYEEYINYNNYLNLNDEIHFYDSHHLNSLGVNKFNKKLLEDIINLGIMM